MLLFYNINSELGIEQKYGHIKPTTIQETPHSAIKNRKIKEANSSASWKNCNNRLETQKINFTNLIEP